MRWLTKAADGLDKVGRFSGWINIAGIAILFIMVCLTCVDVILRNALNRPITGVYELTCVMLIIIVFLSIPYTHYKKSHVNIDIILNYLSPRALAALGISNTLICAGLFCIVVWRTFTQFLYFWKTNAVVSQTVKIPNMPFAAIVTLGCLLLLILLVRDLFENIAKGIEYRFKGYQWIVIFGVPILIAVLALFWMHPDQWNLSAPFVGIIGIIFSLIFMFAGIPISFALILSGFLFIGNIQGIRSALSILGSEMYRTSSTYSWSVIPFFVFMGHLSFEAGFGKDLYTVAHKWFGRMLGGLGIATIGASTAFAAIVGTGLAPIVTMGSIALPEMRRYKYDDRLSTGCIVAGATLGPIIPPSTLLIIYGVLTQQSIGKLFMAGIIPGLLLFFVFAVYIYIQCKIRPDMGPRGENSSLKAKITSLKSGAPVAILFIVVIGGIYIGLFSATEAGAIGCGGVLLFAVIMGRMSWQKLKKSLLDSGKTNAMVFLMLIGGVLFSRFIAFSNLTNVMTEFISGLHTASVLVIIIILIIFLILGCFMDMMPLMLVGVPVVHPIALTLGYDPIWFTLILIITIGVGAISPPVGINLFTLKAVRMETNMGTIFQGVLPFVCVSLIFIAIMFIFPGIITWLPNLLY